MRQSDIIAMALVISSSKNRWQPFFSLSSLSRLTFWDRCCSKVGAAEASLFSNCQINVTNWSFGETIKEIIACGGRKGTCTVEKGRCKRRGQGQEGEEEEGKHTIDRIRAKVKTNGEMVQEGKKGAGGLQGGEKVKGSGRKLQQRQCRAAGLESNLIFLIGNDKLHMESSVQMSAWTKAIQTCIQALPFLFYVLRQRTIQRNALKTLLQSSGPFSQNQTFI